MISKQILETLRLDGALLKPVGGGSINSCYRVTAAQCDYFLKTNNAEHFPDMFLREAEGLNTLACNSEFSVPKVIANGTAEGQQYLLLEYLEPQQSVNWQRAGQLLAQMHLKPQKSFGWHNNNYIGSLQQQNNFENNWSSFYAQHRVLPLARQLRDSGSFNKTDAENAERLCKNLEKEFPEEKPAMLHGDLWSGNFMFSRQGPSIFDPAVYCGHREMDIGMTLLFGGFPSEFYHAYEEIYPLQKEWRKRIELTQLYPLLVHAVLFGGGYITTAQRIIKKYSD